MGDEFGDFASDVDEALRIVSDLAILTEQTAATRIGELIERARRWRAKHVSEVGE